MTHLTDEMRAQGWVEHDGGPCPVDPESKPGVMFRDGEVADAGDEAGTWVWEHEAFSPAFRHLEIVAYRMEPSQ